MSLVSYKKFTLSPQNRALCQETDSHFRSGKRIMLSSGENGNRYIPVHIDKRRKNEADKKVLFKPGCLSQNKVYNEMFSGSTFDDDVIKMIREFDEKCAKVFEEEEKKAKSWDEKFRNNKCFSSGKKFENSKLKYSSRKNIEVDGSIAPQKSSLTRIHHIDEPSEIDQLLNQEKKITADKFEVNIGVKGFQANDLSVEIDEGCLIIYGSMMKADGNIEKLSRQLKRIFQLPKNVVPNDVTACLLPSGVLQVEAPIKN